MDINIILNLVLLALVFAFGTWFCIKCAQKRQEVQKEAEMLLENECNDCQEIYAELVDKKEEVIMGYRSGTKHYEYYLRFVSQNNESLSFTVDKITYDALEINQQGTLEIKNDEFYGFK